MTLKFTRQRLTYFLLWPVLAPIFTVIVAALFVAVWPFLFTDVVDPLKGEEGYQEDGDTAEGCPDCEDLRNALVQARADLESLSDENPDHWPSEESRQTCYAEAIGQIDRVLAETGNT